MGTEIERRFLLRNEDWRAEADAGRALRQFYLAAREGVTVRLRLENDRRAVLAVKTGEGLARQEYQYEVPVEDARALEAARLGHTIEKRRFRVPLGDLVVEIDVFAGALAPLVLAEIELPHAEHDFERPAFLGREITGDARYGNAALALHGLPEDIAAS